MNTTTARRAGLLGVVITAIFIVVCMMDPSLVPFISKASGGTPPPPPKTCSITNVYYADSAPIGSNNFGPTQSVPSSRTISVAQRTTLAVNAYERLLTKMGNCATSTGKGTGDSLFAATTVAFVQHSLNLVPASAEATGNAYIGNQQKSWITVINNFVKSIKTYTAVYDPHMYQTFGMVPHGSKQPSLVRSTQDVQVGWALVVTFKNGAVREFRIVCDLQPVAEKFPNASTAPVPPGPPPTTCQQLGTCSTAPGCTSNCTTMTTTSPTCVCESKVQPPNPPPAQAIAVPTAEPSLEPPNPVNTAALPTSTPDGYNGGSTSQPGTTAPPSTSVPSGTATGDPGGF